MPLPRLPACWPVPTDHPNSALAGSSGPQRSPRPRQTRAKQPRPGGRHRAGEPAGQSQAPGWRAGPLPLWATGAGPGPYLPLPRAAPPWCLRAQAHMQEKSQRGRGQRWQEPGAGTGGTWTPPPAVGPDPVRAPAGAQRVAVSEGVQELDAAMQWAPHPLPRRPCSEWGAPWLLAAGPSEPFRRGGQGPPWEAGSLPSSVASGLGAGSPGGLTSGFC